MVQSSPKKLKWVVGMHSKLVTRSTTAKTMSTTIMINVPQSMEIAFNEMRAIVMAETVKLLAEKYGFDATEASLSLNISEAKVVAKRVKKPVVALTEEEKADKAVTKEADKATKAADKKAEKDAVKADKAAKKAAKEAKPKRAATGYQLYSKSVHEELKADLINALVGDAKLESTSIMSAKGAAWTALDQAGKDMWNAKAATAKAESTASESNDEE
jgi:hypothetical protein